MALTRIVLADLDEDYLLTLERVFVREYRFTAEIILISQEDVLQAFFAVPQDIDILVLNEKLYDQTFVRHNVEHLFLLTENKPDGRNDGMAGRLLYKYTSSKLLLDTVISRSGLSHATNLNAGVAKVIVVFSPVGGAGQTTLAAGLCALFARNFRRSLFVGTDSLQTFGNIIAEKRTLAQGTEKTLKQKSKYAYDKIKPLIVSGLYDIVPPFPVALASLGVTQEDFSFLIDIIRTSGDYDYIVVDGGADFSEGTAKLMAMADQILLVTLQQADAVHKLHCLLDSIDCSDEGRFGLVCNRYRAEEENHLLKEAGYQYPHTDYIEFDLQITPGNSGYMADLQSLQKLGQLYF